MDASPVGGRWAVDHGALAIIARTSVTVGCDNVDPSVGSIAAARQGEYLLLFARDGAGLYRYRRTA